MKNKLISAFGLALLCLQGCAAPIGVTDVGIWVANDVLNRKDWKHDEIVTNSAYLLKKDKENYCFTLEYVYYRRDDKKISPATLEVFYNDKKVLEKEVTVEMKLQQGSAFQRSIPVETETTYCVKLPVKPKEGEILKFNISTQNALATAICKVGEVNEKIPCDHKSTRKSQAEEKQNQTTDQKSSNQTTSQQENKSFFSRFFKKQE